MKSQTPGAQTSRPVTVHVPSGQLMGEVVQSEDSRLPPGAPVGLRLADMEGILEPSATVQGVTSPITVISHERLADLSSEVTFEFLDG
jgi:uncharacterized lipoprotein YbaY